MERSIGMLIFQAICYSGEAAGPPPLFSVTQSLHSRLSENLRPIATCCSFCMKASSPNSQTTDILSFTLYILEGFWHFDLSNKEKLVFVVLTVSKKFKKQFYSPQKFSKRRNNLFFFVLGTFSVLSALQSDVVVVQHLRNSRWKACLFAFAGSGDSCPLAGSKNRLRTQMICSPGRPGGTHAQMGLNSFLRFSLFHATRWFMWCVMGDFFVCLFFFLLAAPAVMLLT